MVYTPANRSLHRETTGGMEPQDKILLWLYTTMTRNILPHDWAEPVRQLWDAIARRVWTRESREKCSVLAIKNDIEKLVVASDGRDERNSQADILLLAEVIDFIYNSKGEHGLRVEKPTQVRALISLMGKMRDPLETPKVEEEEEYVVPGADDDSKEAYDTSDASSVAYTVKSIASWKERTSWFFRLTRGKKRSVA